MGNVGSVAGALKRLGNNCRISNKKKDIVQADGLILPGVGAFGAAMHNLAKLNLIDLLNEEVIGKKKPFLGICLGMQLLAKDSVEQGFNEGLGWIDGHVHEMETRDNFRVPHVGWNDISFTEDNLLFNRLDPGAHFYFDHSYYLKCPEALVVAKCNYGCDYAAAVHKGNIFAVQFHPEKSQRNGLKMLRNFLNVV